jgi:hypothetical protein
MLIRQLEFVRDRNIEAFAWIGLSYFTNREYCKSKIVALHNPEKSQVKNIAKQAEQIRLSILLAREYYETSKVSSLATKPVLLYYSCMSLALAEILLKQDGRSSLDVSRSQHKHHGLEFSTSLQKDIPFADAANKLRVKPMKSGERYMGTYELWRRSARHLPIIGSETKVYVNNTQTKGPSIIYSSKDEELKNLDDAGVSLADCLLRLPMMARTLYINELATFFVPATLERFRYERDGSILSRTRIHPSDVNRFRRLLEQYHGHPSMVNCFEFHEISGNGLIIDVTNTEQYREVPFEYPNGINAVESEVSLCSESMRLNEFGNIYVSLFILSNIARYYPDVWIWHIENQTPLSLVAAEFCEKSAERMALMAYSELSRVAFLEKSD